MAGAEGSMRLCSGWLSGSTKVTSASVSPTSPVSMAKISRQPPICRIRLPARGANRGETPQTRIIMDNSLAAWGPVCWSRTTAREMVMPEQAPSPCRARSAIRLWMSGANTQPTEATRKTASPTCRGRLRPKASDRGP